MRLLGHNGEGLFVLETSPGRGRPLVVVGGTATLYPETGIDNMTRSPITAYDGDAAAVIALAEQVERDGEVKARGDVSIYRLAGVTLDAA